MSEVKKGKDMEMTKPDYLALKAEQQAGDKRIEYLFRKFLTRPPSTSPSVNEDGNMTCPMCGGEYVSFHKIEKQEGNDNYEAHPKVRGDLIKVYGKCEGCHGEFSLCLGFHKGHTKVWFESE